MKRILLIISMVCMATLGWADQITREQALRQAQQFLSQKGLNRTLKAAETQMSRARARGLQSPDYYYVFNAGVNQGFVIVSGDDRTEAILGYSNHGSFDVDKIPCNMVAWLEGYADQIKFIQDNKMQVSETPIKARGIQKAPAVPDLISTKWDQGEPYNLYCPYYNELSHCPTGCTVTAMAQIMKKYNYPAAPTKTIPAYTTENTGIPMDELPPQNFDWGNMLDVYSGSATAAQNSAVAILMRYVGGAMKTNYSANSTSTWDKYQESALKEYFGYGSGVKLVRRGTSVTDTEWDNLIYHEISNGRPVLYNGQSSSGNGHSFVVHGYDGSGRYAVNWGWGSAGDGYYLLNNMTPTGSGIGAGAGQDYNYDQTALVGISPNNVETYSIKEDAKLSVESVYVGDPAISKKPTTTEYTGTKNQSGSNGFIQLAINFTFGVDFVYQYKFEIGFVILQNDVLVKDFNKINTSNITGGGSYYTFTLSGSMGFGQGLANGDYQLKLAYKRDSSPWTYCVDADNHVINLHVTDTQIQMTVTSITPGPGPVPGVTQADLDALKALYASVKTAVNTKMTTLKSSEDKLTSLEQKLTALNTDIDAVNAKIAAISQKLAADTYLSAEQKDYYTNEIGDLKNLVADESNEIVAKKQEIEAVRREINTLNEQLGSLLSSIDAELTNIESISTVEALNASQARAADLNNWLTAINVEAEINKVASLEAELASDLLGGLKEYVASLAEDLNNDIEVAKEEAAAEEEAKKQLEAGKKALTEALDALKKTLAEKNNAVATIEKRISDLEASLKGVQSKFDQAEKDLAAVRERLKSDKLSAEKKKEFEATLKQYEAVWTEYNEELKTAKKSLEDAKKLNSLLKDDIAKLQKDIDAEAGKVSAITTAEALKAAQEKADALKESANGIDVATVDKMVTELEAKLAAQSLMDLAIDAIAQLKEDIKTAINEGEEEEKMVEAKEKCRKAVEALTQTIEEQKALYEANLASLQTLKDALSSIESIIVMFQTKAEELSQLLADLSSASVRTRTAEEEIAKCYAALEKINQNIAELTAKSNTIKSEIADLEGQIAQSKATIEEAEALRHQIEVGAAGAIDVADVEKLTQQATAGAAALDKTGTKVSEDIDDFIDAIIIETNALVADINAVTEQIKTLREEVTEITGISAVTVDESNIQGRYDLSGRPVDASYKGIVIVRTKDGKTMKLNIKR